MNRYFVIWNNQEILATSGPPWILIFRCGLITWCLDFCLSLQKAGASWEIITKQFFCMVAFFGLWNWAVFNGIFYLSDKTAHLGQSWLSECGKTFLVAGAIFCFAVLGFGAMITSVRSTKLVLACHWVIFYQVWRENWSQDFQINNSLLFSSMVLLSNPMIGRISPIFCEHQ